MRHAGLTPPLLRRAAAAGGVPCAAVRLIPAVRAAFPAAARAAVCAVSILATTPTLQAQELTLFEPVDTGGAAELPEGPQPLEPQNGQPAFTVRGTLQVGDQYRAVLVDRAGQSRTVTWQPGAVVPLPGYAGFGVTRIDARTVSLQHPASDPCVAAAAQGVTCQDGSTSLLRVATASAPLQQAPAAVGPTPPAQDLPAVDLPPMNPFEAAIRAQAAQQQAGGQPGTFVNPFNGETQIIELGSPEGQQQREARQQARQERLNRLQLQRIPADQVPPGMRVVTTPFGDRLVPVGQ